MILDNQFKSNSEMHGFVKEILIKSKYIFLVTGLVFTVVGLVFLGSVAFIKQMDNLGEMIYVFVGLGVLCVLIGLPTLIYYFFNRGRIKKKQLTEEQAKEKQKNVGALIGSLVAGSTLISLLVAGILVSAFIEDKSWIGNLIALVAGVLIIVAIFIKRALKDK